MRAMVIAMPMRKAGVARAIMKYKATSHSCMDQQGISLSSFEAGFHVLVKRRLGLASVQLRCALSFTRGSSQECCHKNADIVAEKLNCVTHLLDPCIDSMQEGGWRRHV